MCGESGVHPLHWTCNWLSQRNVPEVSRSHSPWACKTVLALGTSTAFPCSNDPSQLQTHIHPSSICKEYQVFEQRSCCISFSLFKVTSLKCFCLLLLVSYLLWCFFSIWPSFDSWSLLSNSFPFLLSLWFSILSFLAVMS